MTFNIFGNNSINKRIIIIINKPVLLFLINIEVFRYRLSFIVAIIKSDYMPVRP